MFDSYKSVEKEIYWNKNIVLKQGKKAKKFWLKGLLLNKGKKAII